MIKKFAAIALGTCFAVSSYALPSFMPNMKQLYKHTPAQTLKKHAKSEHYTDFTGTWTGACNGNEPDTINIENDDISIDLGGAYYHIGGLNTMSQSAMEDGFFEHMSFDWNQDRTALSFRGIVAGKIFPMNNQPGVFLSVLAKATFSLENDNLIIKGKFSFLDDSLEERESMDLNCSYTRDSSKASK